MKIYLAPLVKRFDAMARRERVLTFVAAIVLIGAGAFALVIDPALVRAKALGKAISEHQNQLTTLRHTHQELMSRMGQDINAGVRNELSQAERSLVEVESDILALHKTLIPAQAMAQVLGGLLKRDAGVKLVSLRNIAPEALDLDEKKGNGKNDNKPAPAAGANTKAAGVLYRHGIELEIEGSYFDLLAYVTEIEKQPWRMLWSETALSAQYPKSRLKLKLHTLSLDASWLSV